MYLLMRPYSGRQINLITLRRATVNYTIFLAAYGFTHPGHDMPPLNALAKGSYVVTVAN
jgi:hypothetical protein